MLTDPYTARAASELLGVDIETAKLLYALYGYEHDSFQPILGDSDAFAVLIDMLEFLFEAKDRGMITLDDDKEQMIESMRGTLDDALVQLRGEHYSRIVFNAAVPVEGEESVALIENIESSARKLYSENGKTELSEDSIIVIGDITSAKDLEDSFRMDNNRVSFLTIAFVFVVLLFTFRSLGAAVLLILVIQSSIWLNFSFPYITGTNLFFVTYLIVSAIQMGATIDYAIVLYNRFQLRKQDYAPKQAMAIAVNESFSTILTSGTIMTAAGFIIALRTTDLYISSIGLTLGRGALISVILVLTVLPQVLLVGNKLIEKTMIDFKKLLGGGADEQEKLDETK